MISDKKLFCIHTDALLDKTLTGQQLAGKVENLDNFTNKTE